MLDCLTDPGAETLPLHAVDPLGLEGFLAGLPPAQAAFLRAGGFAAKAQEIRLLPGGEGIAGAVGLWLRHADAQPEAASSGAG